MNLMPIEVFVEFISDKPIFNPEGKVSFARRVAQNGHLTRVQVDMLMYEHPILLRELFAYFDEPAVDQAGT